MKKCILLKTISIQNFEYVVFDSVQTVFFLGMKQCQLEGQDYSSKSSNCTFGIKVFWGTKSFPRHRKKIKQKIITKIMICCLTFDRK